MDDAFVIEILLAAVLATGIGFGAWIGRAVVNMGERLARVEAILTTLTAQQS